MPLMAENFYNIQLDQGVQSHWEQAICVLFDDRYFLLCHFEDPAIR